MWRDSIVSLHAFPGIFSRQRGTMCDVEEGNRRADLTQTGMVSCGITDAPWRSRLCGGFHSIQYDVFTTSFPFWHDA